MRRVKYLFCILLAMQTMSLEAQTKNELREMFFSAEVDILYEDYAEALPKYLNLLQIYPENYNFYFRIGQCYINTPGEKEKSISYLETASQHTSFKYHEGRFRETDAPFDAFYYLANAYRINNDLDKALETYNHFLQGADAEIYDTSLVNFQIKECHVARKMMADPVYVAESNLGNSVNARFSESSPVVSSDEKTLVFTRALQFYDAVFYSQKIDGQWSDPVNLTPQLGIDQDYFSSSLTGDGSTLFLYKTDNYEGNIYMSRFSDGRWSNVIRLNDNINTKYWESHATLSSDGSKLYFTSNRKESLGGLDIFVAEKDSTGDWGVPENLGPVINSVYHEEAPFLANNDRTLFFCSRGHSNMGGYDIFRSDLNEAGEWTTPVNLGYPVNTTDDDLFFSPVGDGYRGYYAKFDPSGYGKMDVVMYEIFNDHNPRNFYVTGEASVNNLSKDFPEEIKITAVDNADESRFVSVISDPLTGRYSLRLPQGSFKFTWSADGTGELSKMIEMPLTHRGDTVRLDQVTLPNTDFIADMRIMTDTAISVTTGDPILFRLLLEPRSNLKIDLLADTLVRSESYRIADTSFIFRHMPLIGDSKLVFNLTDRFGNITSADVSLNRTDYVRIANPQYEKIIARKQINALLDILKKYADDDVRKILNTIDPDKETLGTADDLISLVRERGKAFSVDPMVIDKLALEVALREGVLTQASVDLMADNSEGQMHEVLAGLDIYEEKNRNWNDLVSFVGSETGDKITGCDLKELAEYILMDPEPGINLIREKILLAADMLADSAAIRDAVSVADNLNLKFMGEWLDSFISEGRIKNFDDTFIRVVSAISYKHGTDVAELLEGINMNADSTLKNYLQNIDLESLRIKKHVNLIAHLNESACSGIIDKDEYSEALAKKIVQEDLTSEQIRDNLKEGGKYNWLWLVLILVTAYLLWHTWDRNRRKGKDKK